MPRGGTRCSGSAGRRCQPDKQEVIAGEGKAGNVGHMVTRERRLDEGRRRARRALTHIGDDLREARLAAGLTQRQVGEAVGISHAQVCRIEHGTAVRAPYETLVVIGAALGLDLPLRTFPAGEPIRDAAQVALLARLRTLLPDGLTWRTEVPLAIQGDRRAWDAMIGGPGWRLAIDAESRLRDVQAWTRREALKRRDDGGVMMIALVADTRHNRRVLRLAAADLAGEFPLDGRRALASLASGVRPSASAVVLI